LQSETCSASRLRSLTSALSYCRQLASVAASQAQSGSAQKFQEYFKTTSASVRGNVAARLRAIANECASTTGGATTYYCTDVYRACSQGVLAYTLPSENLVVSCPIFFNNLPVITRSCHVSLYTPLSLPLSAW
jgi:deuterolysin